jgi:hypothetical protein
MLDQGIPAHAGGVSLPRESATGVRHYPDIDTWLVARGPWRATVTANDWQYMPEGHASGGTLSLLWHDRAGVLACASLTRYQLVEPNNQPLHAEPTAPLTPSIEVTIGETTYTSANDLAAAVESRTGEDGIELVSRGLLRDGAQKTTNPETSYRFTYRFTDNRVQIRAFVEGGETSAQLLLPIVASREEREDVTESRVEIAKSGATVRVASSRPWRAVPKERVFNHVPGFQALVLGVDLGQDQEVVLDIEVV